MKSLPAIRQKRTKICTKNLDNILDVGISQQQLTPSNHNGASGFSNLVSITKFTTHRVGMKADFEFHCTVSLPSL
jgi:hypothetical protein